MDRYRGPVPDPVFLITGASGAIGTATARAAARAGYRVVLAARQPGPLHALAAEDVARAVMYAVSQPAGVDVSEIVIRPVGQDPFR
jgi:NADP-dependent 3-hydroxy acid dehydrogenase YdfG